MEEAVIWVVAGILSEKVVQGKCVKTGGGGGGVGGHRAGARKLGCLSCLLLTWPLGLSDAEAEPVSCWPGSWVLCSGPSLRGIPSGSRADPRVQRASSPMRGCGPGEGKPICRQDPRLPWVRAQEPPSCPSP